MNPTALLFLAMAIASEVAGTAGLKASEGFARPGPSLLALLGYALAFGMTLAKVDKATIKTKVEAAAVLSKR